MTVEVARAQAESTTFEDPAFMSRLDVVFADLDFEAVEADQRGRSTARAWANAWVQAQTLGALAGSNFLRKQFLDALGRNVGFAGRALLVPLG